MGLQKYREKKRCFDSIGDMIKWNIKQVDPYLTHFVQLWIISILFCSFWAFNTKEWLVLIPIYLILASVFSFPSFIIALVAFYILGNYRVNRWVYKMIITSFTLAGFFFALFLFNWHFHLNNGSNFQIYQTCVIVFWGLLLPVKKSNG